MMGLTGILGFYTVIALLSSWTFVASQLQFQLPLDSPQMSSGGPNLQTDITGRVYVSAESRLYRLDHNLNLEETKILNSCVLNISLSSDGRWLVVCLTDLSCEVYNTTNLSAPPVFRRENAIRSADNVALFAADDSFYVGSVEIEEESESNKKQTVIALGHYGFTGRRNGISQSGEYSVTRTDFERNYYSGVIVGNYTYYFAIDSNPATLRGIRVMRVCHDSNFSALQELTLGCGGVSPTSNTRITGLEFIENFAGLAGKNVALTRSRPGSNQNYICFYSLEAIDDAMQRKYNSCSTATNSSLEKVDVAWLDSTDSYLCSNFQALDMCHFTAPLPLALDDVENSDFIVNVPSTISVGTHENPHLITASTAASVQSLSLFFLAFLDGNGDTFVIGFNVKSTNTTLFEDSGFDTRLIADGPVRQLSWLPGTNFIIAITNSSIIRIPVDDCMSQTDCTGCLGNGNPFCGWCVVERKCSKRSDCSNFNMADRWLHANSHSSDSCPTISSISPEQYLVHDPQPLTLSLVESLPEPLEGEDFRCQFTGSDQSFSVVAVGSGLTYTCNISRERDTFQELVTTYNVSLVSSLFRIPFTSFPGALKIYNCTATSSCSQCLQTSNICGWCRYNKICSGTSSSCINGSLNYLQVGTGGSQDFTDICPLIDQPLVRANYVHPVQTDRNIEIITRNLPPEIDGFQYKCLVGNVELPAIYNSETSLTCLVNGSQLVIPSDSDGRQQRVPMYVRWVGQNSMGAMIDSFIDNISSVNVILYNCSALPGCSSCTSFRLVEGFECGWCRQSFGGKEDCNFLEVCSGDPVSEGSSCPAPVIKDFYPKKGPIEGGTTVTITGRELGITFDDFTPESIKVGNVLCTLVNASYVPGVQVLCTTGRLMAVTNTILIRLHTNAVTSSEHFVVATPKVSGVSPSFGPMAGGTLLIIWGENLDIGNQEDTTIKITMAGGIECVIDQATIQVNNISCTTLPLSGLSVTVPLTAAIVVSIDSATINNSSVQYTYTQNPHFDRVLPANTIPSGGIQLTFSGEHLDVVQHPMLVINSTDLFTNSSITECTVLNSSTIMCVAPPLSTISLAPNSTEGGLNYTIIMDGAPGPDSTIESLQLSVRPNPGNFDLLTRKFMTEQAQFMIQISGENLDSVLPSEIRVTVGEGVCAITAVQTMSGQVYCIPPSTPPGGITMATIKVFVGEYLEFTLDGVFDYGPKATDSEYPLLDLSFIIPVASIPLLLLVIVLILLCICILVRKRRKHDTIFINEDHHPSEYAHLTRLASNSSSTLLFADEEILNRLPSELIIPTNQLRMTDNLIGQGEFGIIYEAQLINWRWYQRNTPVAVKRLKGLHSASDVTNMLAEIVKMEDLHHPNVMSLIGVHLDTRTGLSIVMPFMANGNLLEYLKQERHALYLDDSTDNNTMLAVNKLLQRICHQIAKGMEYLALRKFVHRDLAARNCMLDGSGSIKVGDFGLAEDVYVRGYFRQDKREAIKVPFRWMAPESLRDGIFSEKSDVWSFGITCWEVFSGGRIPYPAVDAMSILQLHERGTRLERPANTACSPENFSLMVSCWALNPADRPTFKQLNATLDELLQTAAGYSEFRMTLYRPETITDGTDPGYHIIANRFTVGSRDGSPATFPRTSQSASTMTTTLGEEDSDLCTNDAYGDVAIDMRPVFSQEALASDPAINIRPVFSQEALLGSDPAIDMRPVFSQEALTSECHTNYRAATIAMRDNAAYFTNSQSIDEHESEL